MLNSIKNNSVEIVKKEIKELKKENLLFHEVIFMLIIIN